MAETSIAWTDFTFNPWTGCSKVSPGCLHCYAEALAGRVSWAGSWGPAGARRRTSPDNWRKPVAWNAAAEAAGVRRRVFCASMADVFEDRPDLVPMRADLFDLIRRTPALDWLLLTKRPQNIASMLPADWGLGWDNVWLGTSTEDQSRYDERLPHLLAVPARVRFVSAEPLLAPLDPYHGPAEGLHWVIAGGESGPGYRPMEVSWVERIRDDCRLTGAAFFFKQRSGLRPGEGAELDGRLYQAWPASFN